MIARGRRNVLGVMVDVVDYDGVVERVLAAAGRGEPLAVSALAVHGVMTGFDDLEHRWRLNGLDIVTPDGQPVRWALRLLHRERLPDRVYGPQLMLRLCAAAEAARIPIYLYGSSEDVLADLRVGLSGRFPGLTLAGTSPSLFRQVGLDEQKEIAARISASGAGICFVGLGCPRQEVFVSELRDLVAMPILAVGAAFDIHAGRTPEPPGWMQRAGLQWLQRLALEPRRLWRRYLVLNPRFVFHVARQRLGHHEQAQGHRPAPMGFA